MHVVVLGAGVAGVTTAYYLTAKGHRVTLVDRAHRVADGASHANGGQLSYSYTDAMAKPQFLKELPRLLRNADPGVRVQPLFNAALIKWGARFLAQCTTRRSRANTLAMLRMARRSSIRLAELRRDVELDFSFRKAGKLVLLRSPEDVERVRASVELKRDEGCDVALLDASAAARIEPALKALSDPIAGAVHAGDDEVADAAAFCEGLIEWLQSNTRTQVKLTQTVTAIERRAHRVVSVNTDRERIEADAVVVCLGAASADVLQPLGIRVPIFPVRGYSVTLPLGPHAPQVSVTDAGRRIVFSRLNGHLRIAGFADFLGAEDLDDRQRVDTLLSVARDVAPDAADYDVTDPKAWGGFRPMTPGGPPLVGATAIDGLFLNTGHGMLGWTLACASAHDAALAVHDAAK